MKSYTIELFNQIFEAIPHDKLKETFVFRIPDVVYSPIPRFKTFEFPIAKENVPLLNNNLLITKNFFEVEPYIDKFKVFGYPCLKQPNVNISLAVLSGVFTIFVSKEMYTKDEIIDVIDKIWNSNPDSIVDWKPIKDYINKMMLDVKYGFKSKDISIQIPLHLSGFLVGLEMDVKQIFECNFEHECKWIKTIIKIEKNKLTLSCKHLCYEYINNIILGNFDPFKDVIYKLTKTDREVINSYTKYGFNISQLMEGVLNTINFHHEFLTPYHFNFDRFKMEITIYAPKPID